MNIGFWQTVILLLIVVYPTVCFWKILPRAGYSPWLALLSVVPFGLLILLGLLAFADRSERPAETV